MPFVNGIKTFAPGRFAKRKSFLQIRSQPDHMQRREPMPRSML